jgi:hypothetical protein
LQPSAAGNTNIDKGVNNAEGRLLMLNHSPRNEYSTALKVHLNERGKRGSGEVGSCPDSFGSKYKQCEGKQLKEANLELSESAGRTSRHCLHFCSLPASATVKSWAKLPSLLRIHYRNLNSFICFPVLQGTSASSPISCLLSSE